MVAIALTLLAGAVGFIASNVDNLALLALLCAGEVDRRPQYTAFVISTLIVCAAALALQVIGETLPLQWIPLLGLIPIALGVFALAEQLSRRNAGPVRQSGGLLSMLALFCASSVDSWLALSVMLVDVQEALEWLLIAAYIAVGSLTAGWLIRIKSPQGRVLRMAMFLRPFLLIGIGLLVVFDSPID